MKNPRNSLNIVRRRPLAAVAAALSLAGCGMFQQPAAAPPRTPEQADAERRVKVYQSDIESALDKVDRERLRAAAEKKNATGPTTAPGQVILASAGSSDTGGTAVAPAGTPAVAAGAPRVAAPGAVAPVVITPLAAAPAAAAPVQTVAVASTAMPAASAAPTLAGDKGGTASALPLASGVIASPLSGDSAVSSSVIAPFTPPTTPGASAMGSMTALVTPTQALNGEASATPTVPAETSVDEALTVLRKNVGEHPTLNTALALALLDGDKPGDAFKKLSEADQKVAGDLLTALDAMKARASAPTLAERAGPLVDAAREWQGTADLALPRLVLATRVDSFGVFTPISGTFEQGKRHTVIIYCEVANFASKKSDDGWYSTKLTQQETLFTEDGLLVWRPNAEDVEDRSLNQRHDFYLVKKLTIPETLAAGKYTLRMNVTDRNTNKIKIVEMPIEIVTK